MASSKSCSFSTLMLSVFILIICTSQSLFTSTTRKNSLKIKYLSRRIGVSLAPSYHQRSYLKSSQMTDIAPNQIQRTNFTGKGCVLVSQPGDYGHFFMQSTIFIFEHDKDKGSKGLLLEKPTAFFMGEMAPNIGVFEGNRLFTGGEEGGDMAIMLGKYDLGGLCKFVGSGIYLGGIKEAKERIMNGNAVPSDFKFFFNNIEWKPQQLELEISKGQWDCIVLPPDEVLKQDSRGNLWPKLRKLLDE